MFLGIGKAKNPLLRHKPGDPELADFISRITRIHFAARFRGKA